MDHSVELIDLAPAPWEQAFMRARKTIQPTAMLYQI